MPLSETTGVQVSTRLLFAKLGLKSAAELRVLRPKMPAPSKPKATQAPDGEPRRLHERPGPHIDLPRVLRRGWCRYLGGAASSMFRLHEGETEVKDASIPTTAALARVREDLAAADKAMIDLRAAYWAACDERASLAVESARHGVNRALHDLQRCDHAAPAKDVWS